jgi:hypothetical protein
VFPRDIVCFRNIYINTLNKGENYEDNNNSGGDGDGANSSNNNSNKNTVYYLLNAFNISFSNITLKFSKSQELEKNIKSLKPQNTYEYNKISDNLPKISAVYICLLLNRI